MNSVILIAVFAVFAVLLAAGLLCFILGWKQGRAKFERDLAEEAARKEATRKAYEKEKQKIKEEVFGDAKKKKEKLGKGSSRERFNSANDSLRNQN